NVATVLAIEVMAAAQALDLRAPLTPGAGVRAAWLKVREAVEPLRGDRYLAGDVAALKEMVLGGALVTAAAATVGEIA
ncbi:MAG TPA: histidine ammonia-lyase, partial [Trueperaceae bacterium]|nr:histidine ammonia-lyase [Trueperaceae bacterium]